MGSPKALLKLDGRSFLSRIVHAFAEGGCDPVVVVTGPEDEEDAGLIADEARSLGAVVAINPDRDSPQIDSVRSALATLGSDKAGVLVSPVDAPGISVRLVRELIAAGAAGAPIALPVHDGRRGHPVLFGRSVLDEISTEDLPQGARTLIQRHHAQLVEVPAGPEVLLDIDTPAEYEALRERLP